MSDVDESMRLSRAADEVRGSGQAQTVEVTGPISGGKVIESTSGTCIGVRPQANRAGLTHSTTRVRSMTRHTLFPLADLTRL